MLSRVKKESFKKNKDGDMNDFLFWCRHLVVPFLFHDLTSLHPPSFHGNDFPTCNKTVTALTGLENLSNVVSHPLVHGVVENHYKMSTPRQKVVHNPTPTAKMLLCVL